MRLGGSMKVRGIALSMYYDYTYEAGVKFKSEYRITMRLSDLILHSRNIWAICILTAGIGLCNEVLAAEAPLASADSFEVPGTTGRFDFLEIDGELNRLLANHTQNKTLDIINLADGKLIKSVGLGAAQGTAVDAKNNRYYVTVSDQKKLVIVDREKLEVIGEVALPGAPDGLVFNPKNGLVYVCHDDATDLWVVDATAKKIVATIKVEEAPEFVEYDPASDRVYQNIKSKPIVMIIDPAANKVVDTWTTTPAEKPHGLALDSEIGRLFSGGGNGKLAVFDIKTGKLLSAVDIVSGVDQIAFDPGNKRIYCASGSQGLSVLEETDDGVKLLGNIQTPPGTHTLAVDPKTHAVWVAYSEGGKSFVKRLDAH
jgi:DNA-binding beta-propeller fold protein YncE